MTRLLFAFAVAAIAGCERVTEYKCNAEQIDAARSQFEFCRVAYPDNVTRQCWEEAARAHCDIVREFDRLGKEVGK